MLTAKLLAMVLMFTNIAFLRCFRFQICDKFTIFAFGTCACFQSYRMAPPYRRQCSDAPFTEEQEAWLILEFWAMKNITVLRRHFQQHFEIQSRKVPSYMAFKRLVERFIATQGTLHPPVPVGRPPLSEETVALVNRFVKGCQREEGVSVPCHHCF